MNKDRLLGFLGLVRATTINSILRKEMGDTFDKNGNAKRLDNSGFVPERVQLHKVARHIEEVTNTKVTPI